MRYILTQHFLKFISHYLIVLQIYEYWYNLYDKFFLLFRTAHFGDRSNDGILNILREKQSIFEKDGGRIEISENPFAIAIVTPIMKRAHCCSFFKNIVFVDSSGSRKF